MLQGSLRSDGYVGQLTSVTSLQDAANDASMSSAQCALVDAVGFDKSQLKEFDDFISLDVVPVVVIAENEQDGLALVVSGAQDFVLETELATSILKHAIVSSSARFAVVRRRLKGEEPDVLGNFEVVGNMFSWSMAPTTASHYGAVSLLAHDTLRFDHFVTRFGELIDAMSENRLYRDTNETVPTNRISDLALELGKLRSGPRDVVEIYGTALKQRMPRLNRQQIASLTRVGQMLLLELMGHLVNYYRNIARLNLGSRTE